MPRSSTDESAPRARDGSPRWAPAIAVALAVLVASLVPLPTAGDGTGAGVAVPLLGSVGLTAPFHLVGYAAIAALATRATGTGRRGLLLAAALATAFGFGVELVQAPVAWRSFAWADVGVNAVGAVVGVAVAKGRALRRARSDDARSARR